MTQERPANFLPYFNKIEETLIVQIFQLIRNWFRSCTTPLEGHSGAPGGRWSQFPVQRFSRGDIWRHCRARGCGGTGCFRNRPEGWGLNFGSAAGSWWTFDDWRRSFCNWCNEVPIGVISSSISCTCAALSTSLTNWSGSKRGRPNTSVINVRLNIL